MDLLEAALLGFLRALCSGGPSATNLDISFHTMKFTDYLAIYAAALSSAIFFWNIRQSRPRIKVDLIWGIKKPGESGVYVFVRNISPHDVHLTNISILYRYKIPTLKDRIGHIWRFKTLPRTLGWVHSSLSNFSIESGCPITIEANKSYSVLIPDATVEVMLEKAIDRSLKAGVQDQLWRDSYSKPYICSPNSE